MAAGVALQPATHHRVVEQNDDALCSAAISLCSAAISMRRRPLTLIVARQRSVWERTNTIRAAARASTL